MSRFRACAQVDEVGADNDSDDDYDDDTKELKHRKHFLFPPDYVTNKEMLKVIDKKQYFAENLSSSNYLRRTKLCDVVICALAVQRLP